MSSSRQIIPMCADQSRSRRVVVVGNTLAVPDSNQQMELLYGVKTLFQVTIYTAVPTVQYNPVSTAAWLFGLDDVPFSDIPDHVISLNDKFNIAGDWSELNPAAGKICFRADLDTPELKAAIKAKSTNIDILVPMWAIIWMLTADGNVPIACWKVFLRSTPVDPTTAKPVEGITHLTTQAAAASYVPQWGDQARWRWKNGGWQYRFEDGFCDVIGKIVDGQRAFTFGDPED